MTTVNCFSIRYNLEQDETKVIIDKNFLNEAGWIAHADILKDSIILLEELYDSLWEIKVGPRLPNNPIKY